MNRENYDWDDILMNGIIGTLFLLAFAALTGLLINFPKEFCIIIGGVLSLAVIVFAIGWCVCNKNNFLALFTKDMLKGKQVVRVRWPSYGHPVLDKLRDFECKYNMSTPEFLSHVRKEFIPLNMNNLDYLEWISLANELPSVLDAKIDV